MLVTFLRQHSPGLKSFYSGTTTFTYYNDGSLKRRTDARGLWTEQTYDPLGRILAKTYSDSTPTVTYEYHLTGSPDIGRLKTVSSSSAVDYYEYDALGNVIASVHGIDGYTGWREFNYDWYLNGSLKTQVYPSGKTVEYSVDDAGRTNKVHTIGKTYVDMTPASGVTQPFTADGRVTQMKLGNNRWETRWYSLPGSGYISTIYNLGTTPGYGDLLGLAYNFSETNNNGNVLTRIIHEAI